MRKALVALSLLVAVAGVILPTASKADSFSFSISDGPDYPRHPAPRHREWEGPRHHGWGHHRHHPRPVYYMPPPVVYAPPVRTVVYTQPQYVVPASVIAQQASPTYYNQGGQMCREYQSSGWVGGSQGRLYGTACLQPDGSWRVVD